MGNAVELIISACLCGEPCRYDGRACPDERAIRLVKQGKAIPVCPEVIGGLLTPRDPCEMTGTGELVLRGRAKVLTKQGEDMTNAFLTGAEKALALAQRHGAKSALLKAQSPSCGCGLVYDGTFEGKLVKGDGVFAALCKQHGIDVEVIG